MSATLAGKVIATGAVRRVKLGLWTAEITLTDAVQLAGPVVLVIGDWTAKGAIVRGGPSDGSATYLVTGGAGGWRGDIKAASYRNDAGVKLSTVLGDAAKAAGETLSLAVDRVVGTAFMRHAGPAWDVLAALAGPWYVDNPGVTQVGPRPAPAVTAKYRLIKWDRAKGLRELATETPGAFVPGALLEGEVIEEVVIHVDHAQARLMVRTAKAPTLRGRIARLVREELGKLGILVTHEYRVVRQSAQYVDLQIVKRSSGLDDSLRVVARPGAAGHSVTYTPGSLVLIAFVRGDATRPFLAFGGEVGAAGTIPKDAALDATDTITVGEHASGVEVDADTEFTGNVMVDGDVAVGGNGTVHGALAVGPGGARNVAHSDEIIAWATGANAALTAIATMLNMMGPVTGAPGSVPATPPLAPTVVAINLTSL